MPIDDADTNEDPKIITGDFSGDTPAHNNKLITDAESLQDPAIRFTTRQWCDAFEMFQEVLWERMMFPDKYLNMPDDKTMDEARKIAKNFTPALRLAYESAWKTLKKDLLDFGLHGAEHFVTVCVDGTDGETPGYKVYRRSDDYTEEDERFEPDYLFIPYDIWQAAGARFLDWYGQQCNAIDPSAAVRAMLASRGIKNENDFLNSDLGRDGLISNPY